MKEIGISQPTNIGLSMIESLKEMKMIIERK